MRGDGIGGLLLGGCMEGDRRELVFEGSMLHLCCLEMGGEVM